MPARKMSAGKPSQCQVLTRIMLGSAVAESPSQGCAQSPSPIAVSPTFTSPKSGLRNSFQRKPTITAESTTGRNTITWCTRWPGSDLSSAKAIR